MFPDSSFDALVPLGWDERVATLFASVAEAHHQPARVGRVDRDRCTVRTASRWSRHCSSVSPFGFGVIHGQVVCLFIVCLALCRGRGGWGMSTLISTVLAARDLGTFVTSLCPRFFGVQSNNSSSCMTPKGLKGPGVPRCVGTFGTFGTYPPVGSRR